MLQKTRSVGLLIENEKGKVLALLRKIGKLHGNKWGLVGGKIAKGETKIESLIRETYEEINLTIKPEEITFIKAFSWKRGGYNIEFELYKLKANIKEEVKISKEEFSTFMWESPENLLVRADLMPTLYEVLKTVYNLD